MALITDIYQKYQIMPNLQEHQLRVAAVAKQICDNLSVKVDSESIIKACLLHDMGNILKFDLTVFPEFTKPEGLDYWMAVKKDFAKKYGSNEHQASLAIAKELGANATVLDCIESISFSKVLQTIERKDIEPKICDNADLRVGPHGVISLADRLGEGRKRYAARPGKWMSSEERERLSQACFVIEKQVFKNSNIKPSDITDDSVAPIIRQLRTYQI